MPTSIIIAAVASYAGAAAVAFVGVAAASFAGVVIAAGVTMVVGGVLRNAVKGNPSTSGPGFTAEAQGRDQMVRSSTATRTITLT